MSTTEAAMRRTTRHDRLDRLLAKKDPFPTSNAASERIAAALDDIGAAISSQVRRTPRRKSTWRINRPRGRVALLLAAVPLVLGSGVAAGSLLSAHTGQFPSPAEE